MVFAFVALAVALYMAGTSAVFRFRDTQPSRITDESSGLLIGGLSAMMGIGGGTLCVPYFNAFGFSVHRAVGTAAAIGLIAPFTLLTAPLGMRLAHRLSARTLKLLFSLFLFATSARMMVALFLA